jgi:hypothetical protein
LLYQALRQFAAYAAGVSGWKLTNYHYLKKSTTNYDNNGYRLWLTWAGSKAFPNDRTLPGNRKPETENRKPETENRKPETRNLLETRNSKLETLFSPLFA